MILDDIRNAPVYYGLGPSFQAGLDYLRRFDPRTPVGKFDLDGKRVRVSVEQYTTSPGGGRDYEAHRLHADIQYLVGGEELIWHASVSGLAETVPYDTAKDVAFYRGVDIQPLYLHPGQFTILWPQDAHKPNCCVHVPAVNKKVVVKVRLT